MNFSDLTLVKKLAIVLLLKFTILLALWWFFVRDAHVPVDGDSVAAQLLKQPTPNTAQESKP